MDDEFGGTAPKHRYFDTIYHISGIRHGLRTIGRRPCLFVFTGLPIKGAPSMDVIPVRTERKNNEDRSEKNIYH